MKLSLRTKIGGLDHVKLKINHSLIGLMGAKWYAGWPTLYPRAWLSSLFMAILGLLTRFDFLLPQDCLLEVM